MPTSRPGSVIPFMGWLPTYDRSTFQNDVSAGLTTAVMLIPQGMAYAMLAGVPPILGLYASTVPLIVYAFMGSSRQLSVGPLAMASLLIAGGIAELLGPDAPIDQAVSLAILFTVLAGGFQIAMGVLRLGGLVNLLSHPVVTGFTSAAALVIGASQLQHVVGFKPPSGLGVVGTVVHIAERYVEVHTLSVFVAVASGVALLAMRRFRPTWPAALITVAIGILVSWSVGLSSYGVAVLGEIPSGLPTPRLDLWQSWTSSQVMEAAPMALAIALVGFMESISAAKLYARQNGYRVNPTVELVSLGAANIAAGTFGGCTVGGALSRTAVNAEAGAKTPFANVVTAVAIGLTLAFLTPLFAFLPTPILAAIILVAVTGLLDFQEWIHLGRIKRDDLVLLLITFFATLMGSIELGIVIGVLASLLWLVYSTTRPVIPVLGRVPGTRSYRCVDHVPDAEREDRIVILRMDAQFFFGNVAHLRDGIFAQLESTPGAVAFVLDASSMNGLDSTAADMLSSLISELRRQRVEVFVSHLKGSVITVMQQTGLLNQLGEGHVYYEVHDAVEAAVRHRDAVDLGVPADEEDFGASDLVD